MAPVRLIERPARAEAGMPVDVMMAWMLTALAWGFAVYLGVRLLDPKSDFPTTMMLLAMISCYQVAAFAVAAHARKARR
jgi:hypothetical protein